MIPFAPFEPDKSEYNPGVAQLLKNVVIHADHVAPMPSLEVYSLAMPAAPKGAVIGWDNANNPTIFAGTATKLYKLNTTTLGWDDITRTVGGDYSLGAEDYWQFTQFGDWVIATSQSNDVQKFDMSGGTNFEALGGSPGAQLACTTIGDFLMFSNANQLTWSGVNAPEFYTPSRRGSDIQDIPDGGDVMTIVPLTQQGGVIFQDRAIRDITPTYDNRTVFSIVKTNENRGALSPRSVVSTGDQIFYLSKDGIFEYGAPSTPIGFEKVDRFMLDSMDVNRLHLTEAVRDPINQVVYWRYKTTASPNNEATDMILAYNYRLGQFSVMEIALTGLLAATTPGYSLEGLDSFAGGLESLPFPLDSRAWSAGAPVLGAFDDQYRLGLFQGSPLEAVIQTGSVEMQPGRRVFVNGWRPIVDTPTGGLQSAGRVATRSVHGSPLSWGPSFDRITSTGIIPARQEGRLHTFELTIPAGVGWTAAHGINFDPEHVVKTGRI
jgi:hypothetical protein